MAARALSHPSGRHLIDRSRSWVGANLVLATTLTLALGVLLVGTWGVGEVYEAVHDGSALAQLDRPVLDWVETLRTPTANAAWASFSQTGGPVLQPLITLAVVALIAWRWRSWTPVVLIVLAEAGALLMTIAGKRLTGRSRPPLAESIPPFEYSPSFPSGHTLNATVIAGVVAYLALHWFRTRGVRAVVVVLAGAYAIAMGASRVYLAHHWLTDVVAAWLLGLAWLAVVIALHRLWLYARAKHGEQRWTAVLSGRRPGSATLTR